MSGGPGSTRATGRTGSIAGRGVPEEAPNPLFSDAPPEQNAPERSDPARPDPAPPTSAAPAPLPRSRRARRVLAGVAVALVTLLGLGAAVLLASIDRLNGNVVRVPGVFAPLDVAERPPAAADRLSFLLVGTDAESDGERGELLMLARIDVDATRTGASVVSIPRRGWVEVPGGGRQPIDAVYAAGGASQLVRVVEQMTRLRVDHFAVVDFAGFRGMVDAIGGIDVEVAAATRSQGVEFRQGRNHLDGAQALAYLRQRDLPDGDLDRAQRQLTALRAFLDKTVSSGLLSEPLELYALLDAVTHSVSVDDTLDDGRLRGLALELRALRPAAVRFLAVPVSHRGQEAGRPVAHLDEAAAEELWAAVRGDTVDDYAARHAADDPTRAPR